MKAGTGALAYANVDSFREAPAPRETGIVSNMGQRACKLPESLDDSNASLSAELIAVRNRDRRAFESVYDKTADRVLSLASRIVGDQDTADDVASDVFLQVWRDADCFDPDRGSAIAWIMTITRSRALDTLRRNVTQAAKKAQLEQQPDSNEDQESAQDLLVATNRRSSVHHALAQLQPAERQLLALAYFRGYSHSELAEITGKPLGTVKTKIRRSLIKLKAVIQDDCMDAGDLA